MRGHTVDKDEEGETSSGICPLFREPAGPSVKNDLSLRVLLGPC